MKQKNLQATLLLLAVLATASCSNETDPIPTPSNNPDAVELGITAGVALTKSAINSGEQSGSDANTTMKNIAVYATGTTYTKDLNNNYALYTRTTGSNAWTNNASNKIMLTSDVATIYAYHPAYSPNSSTGAMESTTALKVTDFSANSTIPVTVFPGGDNDASIIPVNVSNADKTYSGSWQENTSKGLIASAPGEVDYMWATSVQASNGKAENASTTSSVNLNMNHAMAMVSFRVYSDKTYKGTGSLTKIVLSNKTGNVLTKGDSPVMKVSDGTVSLGTVGDSHKVEYTRKIGASGFTLIKEGVGNASTAAEAKDASPKFSILVMPETAAANKSGILASFTIDGAVYAVNLPDDATSQWEKGKNYLYTVKLSGSALTITSVSVAAWNEEQVSGDLPIN